MKSGKQCVICKEISDFPKLMNNLQDNWPIFFRNIDIIKFIYNHKDIYIMNNALFIMFFRSSVTL